MKKEATKIYCMGNINPNHISISDFLEYVNDQPLMLAKGPLPCQLVRNRLVRMKWCAVMLLDLTPRAYFVALSYYCFNAPNNQMHWCLYIFIPNLVGYLKPQQCSQTDRCLTQAAKTLLFFCQVSSKSIA